MTHSTNHNGETSSGPLLFSVPTEVFNNIISQVSNPDLRSLSRTCRSLRFSESLTPGLFYEALSADDFPLTKKRLDAIHFDDLKFKHGKRGPRVYGFAAEMHDDG